MDEYRDTIKKILRHNNILNEDEKSLSSPYLHIAFHGMRDIYGRDVEIGTRFGETCDVKITNWIYEHLTEELDADIGINERFIGDESKSYHRRGNENFNYIGYGENFNTVQLEISRFFRKNKRREIISALSILVKEFNSKSYC